MKNLVKTAADPLPIGATNHRGRFAVLIIKYINQFWTCYYFMMTDLKIRHSRFWITPTKDAVFKRDRPIESNGSWYKLLPAAQRTHTHRKQQQQRQQHHNVQNSQQ